jgi:hypothetical protein
MVAVGSARESDHVNGVRGHPDVNLPEARLEAFFELTEELAVFRQVGHINDDAHGVILVNLVWMLPPPTNDLRFPSHGPELILQSGTDWPSLNRSGRSIS